MLLMTKKLDRISFSKVDYNAKMLLKTKLSTYRRNPIEV